MRICIIEKAEKRRYRGFKLSEEREIGSVGLYFAELSETVSERGLLRLIRIMRRLGITLCAVYEGFRFEKELAKGGLSVLSAVSNWCDDTPRSASTPSIPSLCPWLSTWL